MKAGFVFNDLELGGAQKMLSFVINSISDIADQRIIIVSENSKISYELKGNIKIEYFSQRKRNANIIDKVLYLYNTIKEIKEILIRNKVDIVCTFGIFYSTIIFCATRRTKIKTIVSERRSPQNLSILWKIISKYIYPKCDFIVFQLEEVRSYYKKIKKEKSVVIPNPYFQTDNIVCKSDCSRKKEIVMAAARLEYEKGIDIGIKSMRFIRKKHPDYKLIIYGKGDFNRMYGNIISKYDLNNVIEYKGLSDNITKNLNDSKIFLLPSRYEGIPNILLEAMGIGMACVAFDCNPGGPRMLLGDNENGIVVDKNKEKKHAEAINLLIENDVLRLNYEKKAKESVRRFNPAYISQLWKDCFVFLMEN